MSWRSRDGGSESAREGYRMAGMNPLTEDAEIYTEEAKRFCGIGLTGYPGDGRFTILTNEIREG